MGVELKHSRRSTETPNRSKEKPVTWTEKATRFHSVRDFDGTHHVNILCNRWEQFKFSRLDFVEILKNMLGTLPLLKLVELNVFLASLISERTAAATEDFDKSQKKVCNLEKERSTNYSESIMAEREKRKLERYVAELEAELEEMAAGSEDELEAVEN